MHWVNSNQAIGLIRGTDLPRQFEATAVFMGKSWRTSPMISYFTDQYARTKRISRAAIEPSARDLCWRGRFQNPEIGEVMAKSWGVRGRQVPFAVECDQVLSSPLFTRVYLNPCCFPSARSLASTSSRQAAVFHHSLVSVVHLTFLSSTVSTC